MLIAKGGIVNADCQDDAVLCSDATDIMRYVRCRLKATYGAEQAEEIFSGLVRDADKPKYEVIKDKLEFSVAIGKTIKAIGGKQ